MKKLPFIATLICAFALLCCCGFLGFQYQNLDKNCQTLQTQASQLKKDNSALNAKLSDSTTKLEETENYLEGQKQYISELSEQIRSITQNTASQNTDAEEEDPYVTDEDGADTDPYPTLYAADTEPQNATGEKIAYLTFDDGPSKLTPQVLDLLDQYNAKATFFVVCKNNEDYAEYLSQIVERGHTLALHSYSHDYHQIYASKDAFLADYQKVYDWVVEQTGYTPSLFRFPGGSNSPSSYVAKEIIEEMERRGFTYFDWNVSSGDGSSLTTTENIIDNICGTIGNIPTPVVLMHDGSGRNATLAALPTVLKNLSEAGYEFRSLDKTVPPVKYR